MGSMFLDGSLSTINYDALLVGWTGWVSGEATKELQDDVNFGVGNSQYSLGDPANAREWLTNEIPSGKAWTISDGGEVV